MSSKQAYMLVYAKCGANQSAPPQNGSSESLVRAEVDAMNDELERSKAAFQSR